MKRLNPIMFAKCHIDKKKLIYAICLSVNLLELAQSYSYYYTLFSLISYALVQVGILALTPQKKIFFDVSTMFSRYLRQFNRKSKKIILSESGSIGKSKLFAQQIFIIFSILILVFP